MAVYAFTPCHRRTIEVANAGRTWRDFTYIDDIVEGFFVCLPRHRLPI